MRIFLDAMGGDNAPQATCQGAIEALRTYPELEISLAGVLEDMKACLQDYDDVKNRLTLVDAPEIITNHESPVMGVRRKTKSAVVMGMMAVRNGEADGFVSAGSTGAVLAGGMFRLGRIPGIERPALAPLMPNGKGYFLLIDCGANVDCQGDWLFQFGLMGDAYMKGVMGMPNPRVGLLNIGAEAEKGNALVKAAYPLMEKAPYNFVGNVVLKFMEGVAGTLMGIIKNEMMGDTRSKIGALLAKPAFRRVKKTMDYTEVGGAPLLGVQGAVVKAHGSSNAHAIACAVGQAVKMINGKVVERITEKLEEVSLQTQADDK